MITNKPLQSKFKYTFSWSFEPDSNQRPTAMATNEMETENINPTTPLDDTHAVIPLAVLLFQLQLQLPVHIQSQLLSPSSRPHLPLPGFAAQLQLQQLDYRQVLLPSNPVLGPLVTDVCRCLGSDELLENAR